jgi:hypothetical protein
MLFVSTRQRFQHGDPEWDTYIAWIELRHLREVRTLDAALNKYVDQCGSIHCEPSEVDSVLEMLPRPSSEREYYLVGRSIESEARSVRSPDTRRCSGRRLRAAAERQIVGQTGVRLG